MRAIDADKELSCKDCIHCEVCDYWEKEAYPNENAVNCLCKYFSPTITEDLVPHGRWIKMDTTGLAAKENVWNCSVCGYPVGIWTAGCKYCPNCGAKMDFNLK